MYTQALAPLIDDSHDVSLSMTVGWWATCGTTKTCSACSHHKVGRQFMVPEGPGIKLVIGLMAPPSDELHHQPTQRYCHPSRYRGQTGIGNWYRLGEGKALVWMVGDGCGALEEIGWAAGPPLIEGAPH
jgi:hypothetical protein